MAPHPAGSDGWPLADPDAVLVLDGGLATELERRGHDLGDPLWSARLLRDDPDAIVAVHTAFLDAGADVVTTASYQASEVGLGASGGPVAAGLIARSVELAVVARERSRRPALVAGSLGPYGAVLGDGSEYRGGYERTVEELVAFHTPRVRALAEAGADLLACETVPSPEEIAALAIVLDQVPGPPAWVSCTVGPGGTRISQGDPLAAALAPLRDHPRVVAVGVNCVAPAAVGPALAMLAAAGFERLVAYPNLGDRWDGTARRWVRDGVVERPDPATVQGWRRAGARLVGGCCGTTPADIAALRHTLTPA